MIKDIINKEFNKDEIIELYDILNLKEIDLEKSFFDEAFSYVNYKYAKEDILSVEDMEKEVKGIDKKIVSILKKINLEQIKR